MAELSLGVESKKPSGLRPGENEEGGNEEGGNEEGGGHAHTALRSRTGPRESHTLRTNATWNRKFAGVTHRRKKKALKFQKVNPLHQADFWAVYSKHTHTHSGIHKHSQDISCPWSSFEHTDVLTHSQPRPYVGEIKKICLWGTKVLKLGPTPGLLRPYGTRQPSTTLTQ